MKEVLNNKMEELEAKVNSEDHDIIAVSETWFQEESNWRTGLEGYKRIETGPQKSNRISET